MLNIQKKSLLSLISLSIFLGVSCSLQGTQPNKNPVDSYQNPQKQEKTLSGIIIKTGLSLTGMVAALKYSLDNPNSSTTNRALAFLPAIFFYGLIAKEVFETPN